MSTRLLCAVVLSVAMALGADTLTAQGNQPALNADIEITFITAAGQLSSSGRYYRSLSGKTREESPSGAIITDVPNGTVTILNSATREATVISVTQQQPPPQANTEFTEFEQGTWQGFSVSKVRSQSGSGPLRELWTSDTLDLVMLSRVESSDITMIKELRNVSLGEPDPALFQIPGDYTVTYESAPE